MINRKQITAIAMALTAVPALAAPEGVSKYEQAELEQEIRSCITEVGNHANYGDAAQVRHEVVVSKRRSIGHKLDIKTSVFSDAGDEVIRAYATRCIVYRGNKPVRFRMNELGEGA